MTIADHIAIIADGNLDEVATPEDIYRNPQAHFTAEFIGERNMLHGRVVESNGGETGVDLVQGAAVTVTWKRLDARLHSY